MEIKKVFRALLVSSVVLGIAAIIYPHLGIHETSKDLNIILMWNGYGGLFPFDDGEEWGFSAIIGLIITMLLLIALLSGLVGSFFFKAWGRILLAVSALFTILFSPAWGVVVTLPIEVLLIEASKAALYIAITMTFLLPLKKEFESEPSK